MCRRYVQKILTCKVPKYHWTAGFQLDRSLLNKTSKSVGNYDKAVEFKSVIQEVS